MQLSPERLATIIAQRDFAQLIGESESPCFEAKSQPYSLGSDSNRELARDVVAFANAQGGVIVIGLKTESSAKHFGDVVREVRPFEQGLVNTQQYRNVLDTWIFPKCESLSVEWLPTTEDPSKGLVVIQVPVQPDAQRPYLVTKTIDGAKTIETVFGYVERRVDANAPMGIVEIQRALRAGLNYDRVLAGRLDGIEALVRERTAQPPSIAAPEEPSLAPARIDTILQEHDLAEKRVLVLAVYPRVLGRLKTIFLGSQDSIRRTLEKPPVLRYAGFDLSNTGIAQIVRGELIRTASGRKVLDLYRDGTFIVAVLGDDGFLAWGAGAEQKLNSLALTEIVYSTARFYELVIADFEVPPHEIVFRAELRHMRKDGVNSFLVPFAVSTLGFAVGDFRREAPADSVTVEVPIAVNAYDARLAAFEVLREIYLRFSVEEDKIPYTIEANGRRVVDLDQITTNQA